MKRAKPRLTTSAGEIGQLLYNEQAYAQRQVNAGGVYSIIGTVAAATRVGFYASLRVVNNSTSAAYIAVGNSAIAAPTGLADGIWLAPNSETFISTGSQGDYVRASIATVGVYKLIDSIVIADRPTDEPQV